MSTDLPALLNSLSGMGLRFWHRLIRTLILPQNAAPNDSAIIIGPDLPPCMQASYSSAIFFRPQGTVGGGIGGRPWMFLAQTKTQGAGANVVNLGWLIYDSSGAICGSRIYQSYSVTNAAGAMTFQCLVGGQSGSGSGSVAGSIWAHGVNTSADPILSQVKIDGVYSPRGVRIMEYSNGIGATSFGAGAAAGPESASFTGWTTTAGNSMIFWPTRIHKMTVNMGVAWSGAAFTNFTAFVRSTLSGTIMKTYSNTIPANGNLFTDWSFSSYIYNNTGASVTTGFGISIQKQFSGAGGTVLLDYADLTIVDWCSINDYGTQGVQVA